MKNSKLTEAVEMMICTDRMHRMLIESKVSEIGMHHTQHRILMHLSRSDKFHSQKELAERLELTPAAVTFALKKIEQDGYITKTLGADNRFNEIRITEKGRALVDRTRKMFTETDRAIFNGFTEEELSLYINYLGKLQENIRTGLESAQCCAQSKSDSKGKK